MGNISLQRRLGWEPQRYHLVREQLLQKRLIYLAGGKGGSVKLTASDKHTLLTCLPTDGSTITHNRVMKATGWSAEQYNRITKILSDEGVIDGKAGPRGNIWFVMSPDVEDWILEQVLPEGVTSVFNASTTASTLGWSVDQVWQARSRLLAKEHTASEEQNRAAENSSRRSQTEPDARAQQGRPRRAQPLEEPGPVNVFLAYDPADEALLSKLDTHLSGLRRSGTINHWSAQKILAGQEWSKVIHEKLDSAHLILLLISSDFIASDHCFDVELRRAWERHEKEDAIVIPVILRACDWSSVPQLSKLHPLPKGGLAIRRWPDEDVAYTDVVEGIRQAIKKLKKM